MKYLIAALLTILGINCLAGIVWLTSWAEYNLKDDPLRVAINFWGFCMFMFVFVLTLVPGGLLMMKYLKGKKE